MITQCKSAEGWTRTPTKKKQEEETEEADDKSIKEEEGGAAAAGEGLGEDGDVLMSEANKGTNRKTEEKTKEVKKGQVPKGCTLLDLGGDGDCGWKALGYWTHRIAAEQMGKSIPN